MHCPKCNSEILDKSKFCPECGNNISAISANSSAEKALSIGAYRTVSAPVPETDNSLGGIRTVMGLKPAITEGLPAIKLINNRYELNEEIGRGGFAVVFRAYDLKVGTREVAVKVLNLSEKTDSQSIARFKAESGMIGSLNHRNIVTVFDSDIDCDTPFIAMEYINRGNLRDYLKEKGKLPLEEASKLFKGICSGIAYAHRKNLIHRDLKPGNVMLSKEGEELTPKIVDFGLARSGGGSEVSISGFGMGTPFYMPPEQRRDAKSVNHTADIYALGKVFYEMLTGEIPDNVDPKLIPRPEKLSDIIFKCIKSKPEERYFSVDELIADISNISVFGQESPVEKKIVTGVNVCPQCSTSNKPESKFCEKCGTGLTRKCPECDTEISVHTKHCPACGTDIEIFNTASSVLQKMAQYSKEKKWGRVIKESNLLPGKISLKGKKGTEIISTIKYLQGDAEDKQKKVKELNDEINSLTQKNDFKSALGRLNQLHAIGSEGVNVEELRISVLRDELVYRNDLYLKNIESNRYQEALCDGKLILEIIPQLKNEKIEGIKEIEASVGGLEQKMKLLAKARNSVRFMLFFKAARLIRELGKYPELKKEAASLKRGNLLRIYATLFTGCLLVFLGSLYFYNQYQNRQQFSSAMNEGKVAMQENRFADAETAFRKALIVKGYEKDSEAITSVQKAQDNIKAEIQKRELQIKEDIQKREDQKRKSDYDLAMVEGSKALSAEKWAEAESAFKKVLAVKGYENDSLASERLKAAQGGADYKRELSEATKAWFDTKTKVQGFLSDAKNPSLSDAKRCESADLALTLLQKISASSGMSYLSIAEKSVIGNMISELTSLKYKFVRIPAGFEMKKGPASDTAGWASEIRHKSTGILMIYVAPGEFMMGAQERGSDKKPGHRVKLTNGYYIGKYEVTNGKWERVMEHNPSTTLTTGKDAPVNCVSWNDCQSFCQKTGGVFRLPTEAEWEFAARGGNKSKGFIYSGSNNLDEVGWWSNNTSEYNSIHLVGQKKPNELGLYDMSGNVREWCSDWYGEYPSGSVTDPKGASSGSERVYRGGGWSSFSNYCGSSDYRWDKANQGKANPEWIGNDCGFRIAMDVPVAEVKQNTDSDISQSILRNDSKLEIANQKQQLNSSPVSGKDWTIPDIGIEFVWIKALDCWVGKYEVTNGEYREFKPDHDSEEYKGKTLNDDRQPVVYVNYYDATAYAKWLTERERKAGRLPTGYDYCLPTTDKWMIFCQCGNNRKYPWGDEWPPKYGNYSGQESAASNKIDGYNDGFPVTCPVEKSGKNEWGLYGVGGNALEYTSKRIDADLYRDSSRGGAWYFSSPDDLKVTLGVSSDSRFDFAGFRLILSR